MNSFRTPLLLSFILLLAISAYTQTLFQNSYKGSNRVNSTGNGMQVTFDGGFIIAGTDSSTGAQGYDVFLLKLNALGDTLWTRSYGNASNEFGQYVIQTTDSGFAIAGQVANGTNWDCLVIKTNKNGDTLWSRNLGGLGDDEANSVAETTGGGLLVSGYTNSFGSYDFYLIHLDHLGNLLSSKTYGTPKNEFAYYAQETFDGGYIIGGVGDSLGRGGYNPMLVKTNNLGDTLWTKVYGTLGVEWVYIVRQTRDSGFIFCGYSTRDTGIAFNTLYLVKTNSLGDTLWSRYYGGSSAQEALDVMETDSGELVLTGVTKLGAGGFDAFIILTDKFGILKKSKTYGSTGDEWSYAIRPTPLYGFSFVGSTSIFTSPGNALYFVRADSSLNTGGCQETQPVFVSYSAVGLSYTPHLSVTTVSPTVAVLHPVITGGSSSVQNCLTMKMGGEKKALEDIAVFPNPSSGECNIIYNTIDINQATAISVFQPSGKMVFSSGPVSIKNCRYDFSFLDGGIYFIRIEQGSQSAVRQWVLIK